MLSILYSLSMPTEKAIATDKHTYKLSVVLFGGLPTMYVVLSITVYLPLCTAWLIQIATQHVLNLHIDKEYTHQIYASNVRLEIPFVDLNCIDFIDLREKDDFTVCLCLLLCILIGLCVRCSFVSYAIRADMRIVCGVSCMTYKIHLPQVI